MTTREPPTALRLDAIAPGIAPRGACVFHLHADTHFVADASPSPDELARAARFEFERDRARWLRSRRFLRAVVARVLDVAPASLAIARDDAGAPHLVDHPAVQVSLSRSGGHVLVGLAQGERGAIGVDVEQLVAVPERETIARASFTAAEIAHLRALDSAAQDRAFLRIWTRKEAVVKAMGLGLHAPLGDIDVVRRARTGRSDEAVAAGKWVVRELALAADVVAAVATGHTVGALSTHRIDA